MAMLLFLVSGVFQWSPLNCWYHDIDIRSGRVRETWMLLYCQVSQREKETWLSNAARSAIGPAEWHRVSTLSPGSHISPSYKYGGAISETKMLEQADELIPFEPDARREIAQQVFRFWADEGSYFSANGYVQQVVGIAIDRYDRGASSVTKADLR